MNSIYHLNRLDRGYSGAVAFIVAARDEAEARSFASKNSGHEGKHVWHNPDAVTVAKVGTAEADVKPGVIVRDVNSY